MFATETGSDPERLVQNIILVVVLPERMGSLGFAILTKSYIRAIASGRMAVSIVAVSALLQNMLE